MTDYRRWRVAGGTYFFTVVAHERRPFLTDELARRSLRDAFRIIRLRRPFRVDAIVLLPDHLHAIWTLPPGDHNYATRWQLIKRRFTKTYLALGGTEGCRSASRISKGERSLWQRRSNGDESHYNAWPTTIIGSGPFYFTRCVNGSETKRCYCNRKSTLILCE
jgi:putative transposase